MILIALVDFKMFRFLVKPLKALPTVPLVGLAAGDSSASGAEEPPEPDPPHQSPLTYGKVFGAIPRITGVTTPNINSKIAVKFGLPCVQDSEEFRKNYVEGRDNLRFVLL